MRDRKSGPAPIGYSAAMAGSGVSVALTPDTLG
jgi:hypothetical protein